MKPRSCASVIALTIAVTAFALVAVLAGAYLMQARSPRHVGYAQMLTAANEGRLESVTIRGSEAIVRERGGETMIVTLPPGPSVSADLQEAGVTQSIESESTFASIWNGLTPIVSISAAVLLTFRSLVVALYVGIRVASDFGGPHQRMP